MNENQKTFRIVKKDGSAVEFKGEAIVPNDHGYTVINDKGQITAAVSAHDLQWLGQVGMFTEIPAPSITMNP